MDLSGIIASRGIKECKTFPLQASTHPSIQYVNERPFYVSPSFTNVKTKVKISTLNPKFILFSAPGATGKSALAKHLSYTYGGIYWNLAKIELGEKTFMGSIVDAVGPMQYSTFIENMSTGKALLVIDALDEAELISGRKMLSSFINDIDKALQTWVAPTIILLARTETAQYVASICSEQNISMDHYEIGFFQETQSKEFVLELLKKTKGKITDADKDCINAYFETISRQITKNEKESFLGYAPVLEAISAHIISEPNKAKLLSELAYKDNSTDIILSIMDQLLKREFKKFSEAFHAACEKDFPDFSNWDSLYLPVEQLKRLLNFVLFQDSKYTNVPVETLPARMIDDYQGRLNTLLGQHPFIQNRIDSPALGHCDFTGPAFRDYLLARLLIHPDTEDLVQLYFSESKSDSYFPSQLFWDYYIKMANNKISSNHVSYLYESFRAKATAMQQPYLQISQIAESDEATPAYIITFGLYSRDKDDSYEFPLIINDKNLVFDQLSNAVIIVPELNVVVGKKLPDSRIFNSTVICKRLLFNTNHVAIESYKPATTLLVSTLPVKRETGIPMVFDILSDDELKISFPNINEYYRLYDYRYSIDDAQDIDITRFIHATRNIFMEFRTHGKDTLAKSAERIDNVNVGGNELKQRVLAYMKERGVIYKSENLYKIDMEKMKALSISFAALYNLRTEQLAQAYADFISWNAAL